MKGCIAAPVSAHHRRQAQVQELVVRPLSMPLRRPKLRRKHGCAMQPNDVEERQSMRATRWKSDLVDSFAAGGAGSGTVHDSIPFNADGGLEDAAAAPGVFETKGPKLVTIVSFTGVDGAQPLAGLITDAAGDLLGTTEHGGADSYGTVFEIKKTKSGYADKPTTLVSFAGSDGYYPAGALLADAAGDVFGTTYFGGAGQAGTVFEIAKTRHGFAGAPTTLVDFDQTDGANPGAALIADAAGDLFGTTTNGGPYYAGTVFEIVKTRHGYAGAPTTLVTFTVGDGEYATGSLIIDAAGDLFGTTELGGAHGDGTAFEIARINGAYAAAPTTLVNFSGADGQTPLGSLVADAAGDLFGKTESGGAFDGGVVFEIAKTKTGYASTPIVLVSFTVAEGSRPNGDLILDAAGDIFGATAFGGANGDGAVFEIAKTKSGYASTPIILASLAGGSFGGLLADAKGNLFGTTANGDGSQNDAGTVFEITKSGFVPFTTPDTAAVAHPPEAPPHAAFVQAIASHGAGQSGSGFPTIFDARTEPSTVLSRPHALA
jgi:uncharacterized repeat protein (TIGR03803 family)